MHQITERLYNLSAYGVAFAGIAVDFESVKSIILFTMGVALLVLQIRLHLIKIRKEKQNK